LVLSTGGIAHAQPPSGRDNVEIYGSCRMRDGTTAYATVTVDDYQRNSSTTTADNSGYLVNVEVWVDGYLDRKNSWWWAQKRNGTVFGGATWKFLGIGGITGMTGWYIEPFQNQVVSVAIYPRRENLQECSINIRVGDAR
jgi:hypothetical protein